MNLDTRKKVSIFLQVSSLHVHPYKVCRWHTPLKYTLYIPVIICTHIYYFVNGYNNMYIQRSNSNLEIFFYISKIQNISLILPPFPICILDILFLTMSFYIKYFNYSTELFPPRRRSDSKEDSRLCTGSHTWTTDYCRVCILCRECTGFSSACHCSHLPNRVPGEWVLLYLY